MEKVIRRAKKDPSPQVMWPLIQQQMEPLRMQISDGLNKNILRLTEQKRPANEQLKEAENFIYERYPLTTNHKIKKLDF